MCDIIITTFLLIFLLIKGFQEVVHSHGQTLDLRLTLNFKVKFGVGLKNRERKAKMEKKNGELTRRDQEQELIKLYRLRTALNWALEVSPYVALFCFMPWSALSLIVFIGGVFSLSRRIAEAMLPKLRVVVFLLLRRLQPLLRDKPKELPPGEDAPP